MATMKDVQNKLDAMPDAARQTVEWQMRALDWIVRRLRVESAEQFEADSKALLEMLHAGYRQSYVDGIEEARGLIAMLLDSGKPMSHDTRKAFEIAEDMCRRYADLEVSRTPGLYVKRKPRKPA